MNKLNYYFKKTLDRLYGYEVPIICFNKSKYSNIINDSILDIELWSLSSSYIKEIVENLKKVESGRLDEYEFGFETTGVHCYNEGKSYYGKKYPNTQVSISYDYGDKYIATDLEVKDILQMMTDWRDYVLNWEKETGKIKE